MQGNTNSQNLIAGIDYMAGKVVLMLNYGQSVHSAKIEEYEFNEFKNSPEVIDNALLAILDNFVQENICKQSACYVVLNDESVGIEYVTVPNVSVSKNEVFVKTELERLYENFSSTYTYQSILIAKNKKNFVYKCTIIKRERINKIAQSFKRLGLNLQGITFASCAQSSSYVNVGKIKASSCIVVDVKQDYSDFLYLHKNQLLALFRYNEGVNQLQKGDNFGKLYNTDDAVYEVYFYNQSIKSDFIGVQLDIGGEPLDKDKIVNKQYKNWQNVQKKINEEENAMSNLSTAIDLFSESLKQYNFSAINNVYISDNVKDIVDIDKLQQALDIDVKFIPEECSTKCPIKDYLHLFGAMFTTKAQPGNVFLARAPKFSFFAKK